MKQTFGQKIWNSTNFCVYLSSNFFKLCGSTFLAVESVYIGVELGGEFPCLSWAGGDFRSHNYAQEHQKERDVHADSLFEGGGGGGSEIFGRNIFVFLVNLKPSSWRKLLVLLWAGERTKANTLAMPCLYATSRKAVKSVFKFNNANCYSCFFSCSQFTLFSTYCKN